MTERHEIVLTGCNPAPLANYLKGLGAMRVLSACDPAINATWVGENLYLMSENSVERLCRYLLDEYAPTPILAPWNGGSGFYQKDNKEALHTIKESSIPRLSAYRCCLESAEYALDLEGLQRDARPDGQAKNSLLLRLRSLLPDKALHWLDAAILLTGDNPKYPPLLGTGGNDGRLDFTNNFMQRLLELIDAETGKATAKSAEWLNLALFGKLASGLVQKAIGQFVPGQIGGPNSTTGFETKGIINPWDFVLMIEGTLLFAAATVRRNEQSGEGVLSYPFTVRAVSAGGGSLGSNDAASSRDELWMPLWSNPANYAEVRALLSEGRVALGDRPTKDALDFVRAVHRLGGYRGVDRFQRYGLLMRSGNNYLATPLERVQITTNPQSTWLDELDRNNWLGKFRKFSQGQNTAVRFKELCHQLENILFMLVQRKPNPHQTRSLLALLGNIQYALFHSAEAQDNVPPVPQLSIRWSQAIDNNSAAIRIACALASLRGVGDQPLPLRSQLFPIHHLGHNEWLEKARKIERHENDPACRIRLYIPAQRDLVSTLITLLQMRLSLPARLDFADKPLNGNSGVDLADLMEFLTNTRMDSIISTLLPGLALCGFPDNDDRSAGKGEIPAAFALCKLVVTPDKTLQKLGVLQQNERLPVAPQLLPKLASGDPDQTKQAIEIVWRRLRSSGLDPVMPLNQLPDLAGIDPRRLAAALLIPLNYGATGALARAVLNTGNDAQAESF